MALRLLETLRDQDQPDVVLADELLTATLPRRLGLSNVVEQQIQRYREEVRRRRRISDGEMRDLFRLVVRRPDSEEVFFHVGKELATAVRGPGAARRIIPRRMAHALARRRVRRGLRALFGRRVGDFCPGTFVLEGKDLLFVRADPGGDACALVSGYCEGVLSTYVGRPVLVVQVSCEGRGGDCCRWVMAATEGDSDGR